jgi:putative Ca2+/H+ antiporter (TMEM165/GDT1 family)
VLVRTAAGLGFLIFAVMAFRRKEEDEEKQEEESEIGHAKKRKQVWLTSFLIIFAAEWGDLTQLATAALVAQNKHPLSVGIGAILALCTVTVVAVFSGSLLNKFLNPKILNFVSGLLFAGIGIFIIVSAVFPKFV